MLLKLVFNSYSIGQDNLNCQSGGNGVLGTVDTLCQPQNGGNPNAPAGTLVNAGPPIDYSKVKRIHEDDSILVKYYDSARSDGGVRRVADGVQLHRRYRLPTWRRRELHARKFEQGQLFRHDALRPHLVPQRPLCGNDRRRIHEQSRPLSGADAFRINGATAASSSPYFTANSGA